MPTLLLRFPGGRYHATPWGHHVNEGLVEWPPSPWRLLRAFVACGYTKLGWQEVPNAGRKLIETLARGLPVYRLPQASVAHSRHYMPTGGLKSGRESTTLVFDSWADVGAGILAVRWPGTLDDEADQLFSGLAAHLGYLGRAESWVAAEAISDELPLPAGTDAWPSESHRPAESGWEQVSLMAPEDPDGYRGWRERETSERLARLPLPRGRGATFKKLEQARSEAIAKYPEDLIACLQRDTRWWKGYRWSQPPGSRRVLYWRRSSSLSVGSPVVTRRAIASRIPSMLLALSTPSGSRSALPMRSRAVPQAELLHRALVARAGHGSEGPCPELTGKDAAGNPLEGHRHAHLFPLDLDGDGHLDHILIFASMGLGAVAQHAVRTLKRTWTKGGIGELRLALAGQGDLGRLRGLPRPLSDGANGLLGPPGGARIWTSFSPFVPPRHLKSRGRNTLAGQIAAELACRGLPTASIEVLPWDEEARHLRHAVRNRRHPARRPPIDAGFAVRLVFEHPIAGPIALGYGCHFGLGLFLASGTPRSSGDVAGVEAPR